MHQIDQRQGTGFGMKWSADGSTLAARVTQTQNNRRSFAISLIDVPTGDAAYLSEFQPHLPSTPFFDASQQTIMLAAASDITSFNLPAERRRSVESQTRPTAMASFDRIVISDKAGEVREHRPITDEETTYLHASMSPNGNKLAFSVYGGHLYVQDLTNGELVDFGRGFFPTWSPDSQFISFTRNEDDGYRHTYGEIVAAAADGSQEVVLYSSHITIPANPYWSPVENRIFFDYMHSGSILYIDVLTN